MKTQQRDWHLILYCLVFIGGLSWTLYIALASTGVPVQDEVAHFLISKYAWQRPAALLSLWGRPVRNITYLLPALGGLYAARIFSVVITGITILIATQIGRLLGIKRLFLIPLFIWFQPWVSALSFAVLPQIPFSFLLTLGIYLALKEKPLAASLAFGLLPLARHEGIALLGLWLLVLLFLRNWKAAAVAFLPLILFNVIFYLVRNEFAFAIYLSPTPTDRYGRGDWFHYLRALPQRVGPLTLLFSLIAILPIAKSRRKSLLFAPYLAYLVIHTLIYRFGLFASGGYHLFLLPLAPAFGLAAALGLECLISGVQKTSIPAGRQSALAKRAILLAILITGITVYTGMTTKPIPLDAEGKALQQAAQWLQAAGQNPDDVYSTHIWFEYFYGIDRPNNVPPLAEIPPGAVIVWSAHYAERRGVFYEQLNSSAACWQNVASYGPDNLAIIFKKSTDPLDCQ